MLTNLPCNDELVFLDNGFVFSMWDSVSNVAYLVCGIAGMLHIHKAMLHRMTMVNTVEYNTTSDPLVSSWECVLLYGWIIVIGLSSTIYHATLQPWSLCLDFFAIKLFALLIIWCLGRKLTWWRSWAYLLLGCLFIGTTGAFMGMSAVDPEYQAMSMNTYNVLVCVLLLTVHALIIFHLWDWNHLPLGGRQEQKQVRRIMQSYRDRALRAIYISTFTFAVALVAYFAPRVNCAWVTRNGYQMHAMWHVLSAISLFYCVRALSFMYGVQ